MNFDAPVTDAELDALKAAAVGTPPNSAERGAVEVAIHFRRIAAERRRQAAREVVCAARNAAQIAALKGA